MSLNLAFSGVPPFTYTLTGGTNQATGNTTASIAVTPSATTTYTIVGLTDGNNCPAAPAGLTGSATVNVPSSPLTPNAGSDQTICPSSSTTLTGTSSGGWGSYTYAWNTGGTTASIGVSPSSTTTYTLTVTDAQNCSASDAVVVTVPNFSGNSSVLATANEQLTATTECTVTTGADAGWTHYYHSSGTILLSLNKAGQNIGSVGNGVFSVLSATTPNFGSNTATQITAPYVSNSGGWYVMNRWWDVQPTTQPTAPMLVRMYFTQADINDVLGSVPSISSIQQMTFYKINNGAVNPNPAAGHNGAQTGDVQAYSWSPTTANGSYFRVGSYGSNAYYAEFAVPHFSGGGGGGGAGGAGFPVEWLDVNAEWLPNGLGTSSEQTALISWATASETNNAYFGIERSYDGQLFEEIGRTAGAGTTTATAQYTFQDSAVIAQSSIFYRIRQVDIDGKFSYSSMVELTRNLGASLAFAVFPNPAHAQATCRVTTSRSSIANLQLINLQGQIAWEQQTALTTGVNTLSVNTTQLPAGTYLCRLITEDAIVSQKLLIE